MIYVLIGIFMALVFALCFLTDKLLQRLSKPADLGIGQSKVRLARANVIFGVILTVAAWPCCCSLPPGWGRHFMSWRRLLFCWGCICC